MFLSVFGKDQFNSGFKFLLAFSFVFLVFLSLSSVQAVYVDDESQYDGSDDIQSIIDNANDNDTVEFVGTEYNNLSLKINKNLNIVSNVGTKFIGSKDKIAFIIGPNVSSLNITGFIFRGYNSSVYSNSSSNINLNGLLIEDCDNGIVLDNSHNVFISDSTINGGSKGIVVKGSTNTDLRYLSIINSSANAIQIINSNGINIVSSLIKGCGQNSSSSGTYGIYINNVVSLFIKSCNITENQNGIGIDSVKNLSISESHIFLNGVPTYWTYGGITYFEFRNGVGLKFISGICDNILIYKNTFENVSVSISFNTWISNFTMVENFIFSVIESIPEGVVWSTSTNLVSNNIITNGLGGPHNGGAVFQANLVKGFCCGIDFIAMHIKLIRTGISTYTAYIISDANGEVSNNVPIFTDKGTIATNIPDGIMTFTIGSKVFYVQLINGVATLTVDFSDLTGDVSVDYYGFGAVINWDREFEYMDPVFDDLYEISGFGVIPVFKDFNDTNGSQDPDPDDGSGNDWGDNNGNGDGSGFGDGWGDGFGFGFTKFMLNQAQSFASLFSSNSNSEDSSQNSNSQDSTNYQSSVQSSSGLGIGVSQKPSLSSSSGGAEGSGKASEITVKNPTMNEIIQNPISWIIIAIILIIALIFGYINRRRTIL